MKGKERWVSEREIRKGCGECEMAVLMLEGWENFKGFNIMLFLLSSLLSSSFFF